MGQQRTEAEGAGSSDQFAGLELAATDGSCWTVGEKIGEGAHGVVHLAISADSEARPAAVKFLRDARVESVSGLARFSREGEYGARLHSRHATRVLGVGTHQRTPFIVMERLRGQTLAQRLKSSGPVAPEAVARIALQLLDALVEIHDRGLIHRDLKPSNIFLHHATTQPHIGGAGASIVVKLCDLGIAKEQYSSESSDMTASGAFVGTPGYAAPELCNRRPAEPHSDLFALGVTLYEAIAGVSPWHPRALPGELIAAVVELPHRPLRDRVPLLDPELAEVIEQCLEKRAEDRVASAQVLRERLLALTGGDETLTEDELCLPSQADLCSRTETLELHEATTAGTDAGRSGRIGGALGLAGSRHAPFVVEMWLVALALWGERLLGGEWFADPATQALHPLQTYAPLALLPALLPATAVVMLPLALRRSIGDVRVRVTVSWILVMCAGGAASWLQWRLGAFDFPVMSEHLFRSSAQTRVVNIIKDAVVFYPMAVGAYYIVPMSWRLVVDAASSEDPSTSADARRTARWWKARERPLYIVLWMVWLMMTLWLFSAFREDLFVIVETRHNVPLAIHILFQIIVPSYIAIRTYLYVFNQSAPTALDRR